jgi:drug/metabolite transporter (DMT)-like permease
MRSAIRFFPAAEGRRDRPLVAVASLCGGVFIASTLDAVAKALSGEYPVHELLFFRSAVAAPVLLLLLLRFATLRDLSTRYWPLVVLRALILSSAYLAFILSVATLQLADGVAIYFTMPLIVAALAGPLLGERVPASRWIAIAVGFAGVLVMLKPGTSVFEPAGLLALWSAIGYAIGQLIARPLTAHVRPVVIVFWQNLIFLAVALALALVTPLIPSEGVTHPSLLFLLRPWKIGPVFDMFLITSLGVLSALAMILFTEAYRLGEANFVAPFEYSAMLWAVIFGFLVWGDLPGPATAVGGAMVAGAGLFMLLAARRERLARLAGGPVEV